MKPHDIILLSKQQIIDEEVYMNYIKYNAKQTTYISQMCPQTLFTVQHGIRNLLNNLRWYVPLSLNRHDTKGLIGFGNQDTRNRRPHDLYTTLTYLAHVCSTR